MLINRCFNIGRHITTIQGVNVNLGVPQCKNYWKWGHGIFMCRIQGSKCAKCNRLHKSKHHCQLTWCCKVNFKMNPPRLETKQEELCPHSFKYSNCKSDHQVDSNICLFWKHRFNREWQTKKYQEIYDNRSKLIHLNASSGQV